MATAYRMAYNASQMKQSSVRVESSRLAALPHVSAAIEWLRANRPPQEIGMNMPALRERWLVERLQQVADSEYSPSRTKLGALQTLAQYLKMI
jgi:hypothetical protein